MRVVGEAVLRCLRVREHQPQRGVLDEEPDRVRAQLGHVERAVTVEEHRLLDPARTRVVARGRRQRTGRAEGAALPLEHPVGDKRRVPDRDRLARPSTLAGDSPPR